MSDHDMSDHDMISNCAMNMLFNWQVKDICIVFEWWHIHTAVELLLSCIAVFMIAAGYEYLRVWSSQLDEQWSQAEKKRLIEQQTLMVGIEGDEEETTPHPSNSVGYARKECLVKNRAAQRFGKQHIVQSIFYALLVAISFWLMLVFMTYNGYLMIAIILGSGFGHLMFGRQSKMNRNIQCH
ncbi:Ctr copper transporter [Gilbertella persicaria]|uniref:Ctr copper transporter n=1 Tax=Gilbertella persicaria TaxID=101096 RepID=UPI002220AA6E|nr:Ctr copper transporter [Gilbertella persicaria]KAI8054161.1 Ctr copper transporter [Gilbertella persicaria]